MLATNGIELSNLQPMKLNVNRANMKPHDKMIVEQPSKVFIWKYIGFFLRCTCLIAICHFKKILWFRKSIEANNAFAQLSTFPQHKSSSANSIICLGAPFELLQQISYCLAPPKRVDKSTFDFILPTMDFDIRFSQTVHWMFWILFDMKKCFSSAITHNCNQNWLHKMSNRKVKTHKSGTSPMI